jgi:peptidoglycan hydrolase CwlO-like protein
VTTTLDYTTALSAAHDDAAASLQRSREQLEELLRTLDQQRAEITDELERLQGALAALSAAHTAAAPAAATPIRAPARPRGRTKAAAQSRPPQPGTNAYRVAEVFAQSGTATAKIAQERTGVDSGSVHHIIRRLVELEWIKPGTREGRTQSYDWSGPALGAT